jgi:hypothetical protein
MSGTPGRSGGHNRKLIADHKLLGTFRPSRHRGQADAPEPPAGEVTKPARLSAGAAVVWDELAPVVTQMGLLTIADARAFSTLCELQSTFEWAIANQSGQTARDTARALLPWYQMFGLTPNRSRLRVAAPGARVINPLDKFLNRKQSKWANELA